MKRRLFLAIEVWQEKGLSTLILKIKKRLLGFAGYRNWIQNNEPGTGELDDQRVRADGFEYQPLISLVIPVWNTPQDILNQTIFSVVQQTYKNWELCIADGNSGPETREVLSGWVKKDSRIKVKYLKDNKGIAVNSNEAISLAQGEFVGFLDHDDLLAPFALFEIAYLLQFNKTVDVIYSDEDKVQNRRRFEPFFKPDFSPDYLHGVNYMPHFLVVRKTIGDQVGWLRAGFEGAQDYDLILRLTEKSRNIAHIPKILYHWRVWNKSTSSDTVAKPYADTAGKKALQEHLNRLGLDATVEDGYTSTRYRIRYRLSSAPLTSIIIPNQDHAIDLQRCIDSIQQKTTCPNFEILIIENGSREKATFRLYEELNRNQKLRVMTWDKSFNYSSINNWAVEQANGNIVLFLNNDTQVINGDWLEQMLQFALRPDVGAVGAKLYYPNGTIQHGGIVIGIGGIAGHGHKYFPRNHPGYFGRLMLAHNISAVTAACLMIRKQVFQEVGGFDENFPLALGDVDLGLTILQKGYLNVWTPHAQLYHFESKTRGYCNDISRSDQEITRFKHKWSFILDQGDRYYNPNLTLSSEDFGINSSRVHASIDTRSRHL